MLAESRHVVGMLGRMKALLRNVQSDHGPVELAAHGITLREAGLDRGLQVQGDAVQLQAAVINLIRDAAEALAEPPDARRLVTVELVSAGDRAELVVGDAGPGMPPTQIAAAPFATSKRDGSGLGLYLVRTCMENHGGTVTIDRSPLGGAEVRLAPPRQHTRGQA